CDRARAQCVANAPAASAHEAAAQCEHAARDCADEAPAAAARYDALGAVPLDWQTGAPNVRWAGRYDWTWYVAERALTARGGAQRPDRTADERPRPSLPAWPLPSARTLASVAAGVDERVAARCAALGRGAPRVVV